MATKTKSDAGKKPPAKKPDRNKSGGKKKPSGGNKDRNAEAPAEEKTDAKPEKAPAPAKPAEIVNGERIEVPLDKIIKVKSLQPRDSLGKLDELEALVKSAGVIINPLALRPSKKNGFFDLIDGNRRFEVATNLKMKTVPGIVFTNMADNNEALKLALSLNSDEASLPLDDIEKARSYKKLLDASEADGKKLSFNQLGKQVGVTGETVRRCVMLLDLDTGTRKRIAEGGLSGRAGQELASITDEKIRKKVIERVTDGDSAVTIRSIHNAVVREEADAAGTTASPSVAVGKRGGDRSDSKPGKKKGEEPAAPTFNLKAEPRGRTAMREAAIDLAVEVINAKGNNEPLPAFQTAAMTALLWALGILGESVDEKIPTVAMFESKAGQAAFDKFAKQYIDTSDVAPEEGKE